MKAFIIVQEGYEYNDEYYHEHESPATVEPKGFTDRERTQAICDQLNGKHIRQNPHCTTEDGTAIIPYKVVEIDIETKGSQ